MNTTLPPLSTHQERPPREQVRVAVIGGGPAGLMAAEALLNQGIKADVFDAMPSLGRKVLMAGKSGLNVTFAEPTPHFIEHFENEQARDRLRQILVAFGPDAVRSWADGLGVETFIGSSGRVFPADMKAAPLLRAWLRRLRAGGVRIHARHAWRGWIDDGTLALDTPHGPLSVQAEATILALGGASWPKLGSDAAWVPWLQDRGVTITPFRPSNCGFDVGWSPVFAEKFQGHPLKGIALSFAGRTVRGDAMVTQTGLEGGPVYAHARALVDAIGAGSPSALTIDLMPDRSATDIATRLAKHRGKKSLATHLKRTLRLDSAKAGLLREVCSPDVFTVADPTHLARAIKELTVPILRPRPLVEAISSAGGITWNALDEELQLKALPGVYGAGEMLDWDAPTGGYLLTACLATGRWAGNAAAEMLGGKAERR